MEMIRFVTLFLLVAHARADTRGCICDPARAETMIGFECGLTSAAIALPAGPKVFFLRDRNPIKREWLVLPLALQHTVEDLSPDERTIFWTAAITLAERQWPSHWVILLNGVRYRTQCQLHAHIGKLRANARASKGVLVDRPEEIPLPPIPGEGLWIVPDGPKYRVETGDAVDEDMLMDREVQ